MKFNPEKVSFGRHETFGLRYSWLPKGFQAITESGLDIINVDDATVRLGVGKNMVSSIRYWLRACQILDADMKATTLGDFVFGNKDRYMEDEATLWLIHWLLATNPEHATTWFWFFNKFHRAEFTNQELQTALSDFTKESIINTKRPAANTIKNDAALLPRMYSATKQTRKISLEDSLDSPLSLLRLVSQSSGEKGFVSKAESRPNLPIGIFGFAVTQVMQAKGLTSMPIEDLLFSKDEFAAPGSVFRLTETDLITKLEQMILFIKGNYQIRETAGIHQIYRVNDGEINPMDYLKKHYTNVAQGIAA